MSEPAPAPKLRLGGMALRNGLLVHGPTHWAASVRLPDGSLRTASGPKPRVQGVDRVPGVRGVARLAEAVVIIPLVKRALPEAQLPFQNASVLGVAAGASVVGALARKRLAGAGGESIAAAISVMPALFALRGGELAAYHGAEHVSIGTYEHGEKRAKEHERCGTHLIGPLLAASAAGNILASRTPARLRRPARVASSLGAVGAAVEVFAWMTRHPGHPLAKALARPGHELQHRIATAEPSPEQLEVAEAALAACLKLEDGNRATN